VKSIYGLRLTAKLLTYGEGAETVDGIRYYRGIVTVFVQHSTCGITTVEYEPGLIEDLGKLWERIAPKNVLMLTMRTGATATVMPTCGLPCWVLR